jgi:hypothetical protein
MTSSSILRKRSLQVILAGAVLCCALAIGRPAQAGWRAQGYHRPVNVLVAGFWLHHTYSYDQDINYWVCYGGSCSDGNFVQWSDNIAVGMRTCFYNAANLTYAVTGVCHQATNRSLNPHTPIGPVLDWGGVGGAGTSNALFCQYGRGVGCYGPPC